MSEPADDDALAGRVDAVVIGASAGGVEAIATLLAGLSPATPVPVLVVLHLPRERPSLLVSVFQRHCALPVIEAEDKEPVRPGAIYLAPPDYHLLLEPGPSVSLSADPPVNYSRPSIDVLFESAVDLFRRRLLGIVLTGANEDGARGLAAIAAAGGIAVVQEPATAQAPYMPEAALKAAPASRVLPLRDIARWLGTLVATGADGRRNRADTPSSSERR